MIKKFGGQMIGMHLNTDKILILIEDFLTNSKHSLREHQNYLFSILIVKIVSTPISLTPQKIVTSVSGRLIAKGFSIPILFVM